MKFSLFRTPKPQRFEITPRYYDPVKEDIEFRTFRIRKELEQGNSGEFESNIANSFKRRSKQSRNTSLLQLFLVLFFITVCLGYLEYGNNVFYLFLIVIPIYLYYRLRRYF